jgi:TonB family protein
MPSAGRAILRALHVIAVVVLVSCGGRALERAAPPGPTATPPVRVGSILMHLEPTTMVRPTRPPEAIERGISGPVVLEVRISETGDVSVLQVLRGDPLLNEAAKAAVAQWKYRPYIFAGRAVPMIATVTVFGSEAGQVH